MARRWAPTKQGRLPAALLMATKRWIHRRAKFRHRHRALNLRPRRAGKAGPWCYRARRLPGGRRIAFWCMRCWRMWGSQRRRVSRRRKRRGGAVPRGIVLYGPVGSVLLGLIFVIACLNTCIGLFSSCSQYFATVFPAYPIGRGYWCSAWSAMRSPSLGSMPFWPSPCPS